MSDHFNDEELVEALALAKEMNTSMQEYLEKLLVKIDELEKEKQLLKETLVKAAIPLEAMLMVGKPYFKYGDEMWTAIENGVVAIRTAIKEKE